MYTNIHLLCFSKGLGTSSILGGAILGALWRAAGQQHSHDSLIHAVSQQIEEESEREEEGGRRERERERERERA